MKKIVVGIGELLWDVFPERKVLGGAPANFAYHASQFGLTGYAVSAIGKDLLGKEILDGLTERKLNFIVESTDFPTGIVQVTLNDKGVPQYQICDNVAWDNIPWTKQTEDLAKQAQAVCFGSLAQRSKVSKETINKFIDAVPDEAYKIFDINLRQHFYSKELIHQSLLKSNVLKINDEEIVIVAKLYELNSMCELEIAQHLLKEYSLNILILTKGTEGSYVITPTEVSFQETPVVHVADTVGAGDSFTGGFVAGLLNGKTIHEAHQLAVEVSAYVCTQHGAMPKLPDAFVELFNKQNPKD